MRCPLCLTGATPDNCIFVKQTKESLEKHMKVQYDNFEHLGGHLLWSHAQKEVVDLLMKYIRMESIRNESRKL